MGAVEVFGYTFKAWSTTFRYMSVRVGRELRLATIMALLIKYDERRDRPGSQGCWQESDDEWHCIRYERREKTSKGKRM